MTVLFSRVRLNPTRRGTRRLVTSPQAMHATVMGSHPTGVATDSTRVLWRLDRARNHELELFVVSPSEPDFTGLVEQAGWPTLATWDTTDYDRLLRRLTIGQRWQFRLTANPVRSRAVEGGRGRVTPNLSTDAAVSWLQEKFGTAAAGMAPEVGWLLQRARPWGFDIPVKASGSPEVTVTQRDIAQFTRRTLEGARPSRDRVAITRTDFTGVLEVTDPALLKQALSQGMGRAKAYGCGLMTLAPA